MRLNPPKHAGENSLRHFARCKRGNTAVIFALSLFPIAGLVGAAVDYSRAFKSREHIQHAIDAASLAALKEFGRGERAMRRQARRQLNENLPFVERRVPFTMTVSDDPQSVTIDVKWEQETTLLRAFGLKKIPIAMSGTSVRGIDNAEVALVLDVTGSMRGSFRSLKRAAEDLTEIVMDVPSTRMAVVPYRMTVNVGSSGGMRSYMDRNARSRWHGSNFVGLNYRLANCETADERDRRERREREERERQERQPSPPVASNPNPNPPPSNPTPANPPSNPTPPSSPPPASPPPGNSGGSDLGSLDWFSDKANQLASVLNPVGSAEAGSWSYGDALNFQDPVRCQGAGPTEVNHFDLFDAMNERWGGCVEARPNGLDEVDTPPRRSDPDSYWVPYLWPDEVDGVRGTNASDQSRNDYLRFPGLEQADGNRAFPGEFQKQQSVWKYRDERPSINGSSFVERGPNAACPEPVLALTDREDRVQNAIDGLTLAGGAGTAAPFGLVWGWRVLSPEPPFTEGFPYDDRNRKVIVLMTDGQNDIQEQNNGWNRSDYGAWGYLQQARLGTRDRAAFRSELDDKMLRICDRVKDRDIEIFTVVFDRNGSLPRDLRLLYQNCSSDPATHSFSANSNADLVRAFQEIGQSISALRISR
ncbi:MAG: TadE/TadG family type IV pilus assembly protein [Pseudomonadota bacterium]